MTMSITFQRQSVCAGGEHVVVQVSSAGLTTRNANMSRAEFQAPVTDADLEAFTRLLLRAWSRGLTPAQFNSALIAGITVNLGP